MDIRSLLEKVKKGAPGIENIGYFLDKKIPKAKNKVPRLKKSVYGVDSGGE